MTKDQRVRAAERLKARARAADARTRAHTAHIHDARLVAADLNRLLGKYGHLSLIEGMRTIERLEAERDDARAALAALTADRTRGESGDRVWPGTDPAEWQRLAQAELHRLARLGLVRTDTRGGKQRGTGRQRRT